MFKQHHLVATDLSIGDIRQRENSHGLNTHMAPATIDFPVNVQLLTNTESTVKCIYQGVQINTFYQYQECEQKLEDLEFHSKTMG